MAVQIGRVNARVAFDITPENEADPGARTHASGRLDSVLVEVWKRWKDGEVARVTIHLGDVVIPADATEEILEAMRTAYLSA